MGVGHSRRVGLVTALAALAVTACASPSVQDASVREDTLQAAQEPARQAAPAPVATSIQQPAAQAPAEPVATPTQQPAAQAPVAQASPTGQQPAAQAPPSQVEMASSVWYLADGPAVGGCPVFPADNAWNTRVDSLAVNARSADWVASIGATGRVHPDFGTFWEGEPIGIPFTTVGAGQPKVPVSFDYADESDPGPYPIPANAPIEVGASSSGDRHVLVLDTSECTLYEMWSSYPVSGGVSWEAGSGAVFDLTSNALRPAGWTSADAAGLPILPGIVRYDEVQAGAINHALRFTVSRSQRGFIAPATHFASSSADPTLPPMGARFRIKASYDCSTLSREAGVVCTALKRYGMIVADNGSNWYVSGEHDARWDDDALSDLGSIPGSAFEAVATGAVTTG